MADAGWALTGVRSRSGCNECVGGVATGGGEFPATFFKIGPFFCRSPVISFPVWLQFSNQFFPLDSTVTFL